MTARWNCQLSKCSLPSGHSDPTKAFYERHAVDYARATTDLPIAPILAGFARRLKRGDKIVDLGCGAGRDLRGFRECLLDPVGIDYSYTLCHLARQHSGAPVVNGDMRQLPFASESLAGASAVASLLHLKRAEIPSTLDEISRVLKPGGSLFTSMKHGAGEAQDSRDRWFSYFSAEEWANYLREAGFTMLEVKEDFEQRDVGALVEDIKWINCISVKN